jgi:hypothetical protein
MLSRKLSTFFSTGRVCKPLPLFVPAWTPLGALVFPVPKLLNPRTCILTGLQFPGPRGVAFLWEKCHSQGTLCDKRILGPD